LAIMIGRRMDRYTAHTVFSFVIFYAIACILLFNIREDGVRFYLVKWFFWGSLLNLSGIFLLLSSASICWSGKHPFKKTRFIRFFAVAGKICIIACIGMLLIRSMPPVSSLHVHMFGKKVSRNNAQCVKVYQFLKERNKKPVIVVKLPIWISAAEYVSYFHRKGLPFYINDELIFLFGERFRYKHDRQVPVLLFSDREMPFDPDVELVLEVKDSVTCALEKTRMFVYYWDPDK